MTEKKPEKTIEDMAADTLAGDLRDMMLTHIRSMENPWSKMSEQAQQDKIYAVSNACETAIRRAVAIMAARDMPHITVSVSKFTVKDGIKGEIVAHQTAANIEKLAEHQGSPGLLVFASPEAYLGARGEAKPDPDQPELPVEDEGEEEQSDTESVDWDDDNSEPFPEGDDDEMPDADPAAVPELEEA